MADNLWRCSRCGLEKPDTEFYWDKQGNRKQPCKECKRAYTHTNEYHQYRRRQQRRLKYKVAHDVLMVQLEYQNNSCAICFASISEDDGSIAVDHNHETGQARGLLCRNCNTGLGMLQDDAGVLLRAFEYLTKGGSWQTTVEHSSN